MKTFNLMFIATLAFSSCASAADIIRTQPWPIKIDKVSSCCNHMSGMQKDIMFMNTINLDNCIRVRGDMDRPLDNPVTEKVAMFSFSLPTVGDYSIPSILNFTQYQVALLTSYAVHNGYYFRSFNQAEDVLFESRDIRWNKVRMMALALDPADGWARDSEYLVWFDADAIVLDFGLRIEELGAHYPHADILASADLGMGLINTGVVVVRNTQWSRTFLERWWTVTDRGRLCEQDAFDLLYKQYLAAEMSSGMGKDSAGAVSAKIRVLPMDRINSHPPAMLHQTPRSQVLHLMGETTAMRTAVFRQAMEAVCAARSAGVLAPQLGVTRLMLLNTAKAVYQVEVKDRLAIANQTVATHEDFEELAKSAHHLCDVLHHLAENTRGPGGEHTAQSLAHVKTIFTLRNTIMDSILSHVDLLRDRLSALDVSLKGLSEEIRAKGDLSGALSSDQRYMKAERANLAANFVMFLKRAAEAGNSLFWASEGEGYAAQKKVAAMLSTILEELLLKVAKESRAVPLHMQALLNQNLGVLEYDHRDDHKDDRKDHNDPSRSRAEYLERARQYLQESVRIFDTHFPSSNDSSTLTEHTFSLQMLSAVVCSSGNYSEGSELWRRTVRQAKRNVGGLDLGLHFDHLPVVLFNAAVCYSEAGRTEQAYSAVSEAVAVHFKVLQRKTSPGDRIEDILDSDSFLRTARSLLDSLTTELAAAGVSIADLQKSLSAGNGDTADEQTRATSTHSTATVTAPAPSVRSSRVRAIVTPSGSIKYVQAEDGSDTSALGHEIEWEECGDNDVDCEDVEVLDSSSSGGSGSHSAVAVDKETDSNEAKVIPFQDASAMCNCDQHTVTGAASSSVHFQGFSPDDPSIYAELSGEQREELKEVRERYAKQASRFTVNRAPSTNAATTSCTCDARDSVPSATRVGEKRKAVEASRASPSVDKNGAQQPIMTGTVDAEMRAVTADAQFKVAGDTLTGSHSASPVSPAAVEVARCVAEERRIRLLEFKLREMQLEAASLQQQNDNLKERLRNMEAFMNS